MARDRDEEYVRRFWNRFDVALVGASMNITELCQKSEVPYKTLTGWRSKHRLPDLESLVDLAKVLRVSLDYLLEVSGQRTLADDVYAYMEANMPGTLDDIRSRLAKKDGSSLTEAI